MPEGEERLKGDENVFEEFMILGEMLSIFRHWG